MTKQKGISAEEEMRRALGLGVAPLVPNKQKPVRRLTVGWELEIETVRYSDDVITVIKVFVPQMDRAIAEMLAKKEIPSSHFFYQVKTAKYVN